MKRTETYFINFNGDVLPFRFSVLSFIFYADIYGKEITDCKTLTDQINYFYCAYLAGCEFEKTESKLKVNEFIGLLDSYPQNLEKLAQILIDASKKK